MKKTIKYDTKKHERGEGKKKEYAEHKFGGHIDGKKEEPRKHERKESKRKEMRESKTEAGYGKNKINVNRITKRKKVIKY